MSHSDRRDPCNVNRQFYVSVRLNAALIRQRYLLAHSCKQHAVKQSLFIINQNKKKHDKENNAFFSISICFASNAIDEDNKVTTSKRSRTSNDLNGYSCMKNTRTQNSDTFRYLFSLISLDMELMCVVGR